MSDGIERRNGFEHTDVCLFLLLIHQFVYDRTEKSFLPFVPNFIKLEQSNYLHNNRLIPYSDSLATKTYHIFLREPNLFILLTAYGSASEIRHTHTIYNCIFFPYQRLFDKWFYFDWK